MFLPVHIGIGNLSLKLTDIVVLSVSIPSIFVSRVRMHKET